MDVSTAGLIGIGHIGASMAHGLRAAETYDKILGYDTDEDVCELALDLDIVTSCPTLESIVERAELLILAVPPSAIAPLCAKLAPMLRAGQVATDVGSVKAPVLAELRKLLGAVPPWFVGGHPIAGTEKQGPSEANSKLFRGRRVVLTPEPNTDAHALAQVQRLWASLGATIETMDAEAHDALFGGISHLPHVVAYALMTVLTERFDLADMQKYAGGGLLDFTRIASSSPELWTDICRCNSEHIAPLLEQYAAYLEKVAEDLRQDRADALREDFAGAKAVRDSLRK